ncbi:2-amino-4-hydroxy-6-hydroxymethyldihydropteridine diphosphokinase [Polaromonas sp.]|uniref:2-amino-4-hydroxy-6- hydroxymethyldihydropteridine diphosphokinase n=1 Tax=Polaromonas sp. TaxID=1869339 RepID=UPI003CA1AFBE
MPVGEHSDRSARVTAYVALGANLGDAASAVLQAMQALDRLPLTRVTRRSSLYKTAPMTTGGESAARSTGPDYINAVVALETGLTAPILLRQLQQLEQAAGRERPYRDAPRTLDLDLLLYGSACIESQELTVPHPRMAQRAFVLVPLAEIAPGLVPQVRLDAVADQAIERLEAGSP